VRYFLQQKAETEKDGTAFFKNRATAKHTKACWLLI
jgi:hypothetical protein